MESKVNKYPVSVVVPTYNRCKLLDYTLNSLFLQTMPKSDFDVVIADDGSTDETLEVVNKWREKLNVKYVYQEDKGYRPGSARNAGILACEGDVCVMIDSGVILNVNCLEEHVNFYSSKPPNMAAIGYVYGFDQGDGLLLLLKHLLIPENAQESIRLLSKEKLFYDVRDLHYRTYQDQIHDLPAPWYYFWTCHVSARREFLIEVGLFDDKYDGRWGCEDNDLGYRLSQMGEIHLLRTAESIHLPHPGDWQAKLEEGYHNCVYFHNKFPTPETKLFLDFYRNPLFADINALRMKMKLSEAVIR
jgi:glycosyltransferase involved in cell wall biosynthesis